MHITLSSGNLLVVTHVLMHPEPETQNIFALRERAAQEFGGFSSGVGFLGSPGWAVSGAATLGIFESLVTGKKEKKGIQLLQRANLAEKRLREHGSYIPVEAISGIEDPDPSNWAAVFEADFDIDFHSIGIWKTGELTTKYGIERKDISDGIATIHSEVSHVVYPKEFIGLKVEGSIIMVRWDNVQSYYHE